MFDDAPVRFNISDTKHHHMLLYNWHQFNLVKETDILCTLISATSANPPTEKRKNLRFKARAIERPILVFPTPGGPERQIIFPAYMRKIRNHVTLFELAKTISKNQWLELYKNE